MGGATSRFGDTDWNTVHGGLSTKEETIDGRPPTKHHSIITLEKQSVVSQREFTIQNFDDSTTLYTSRPMAGTTKCFDLCDKDGHHAIFGIYTNSLRTQWMIYSYQPNWPSQEAEEETNNALASHAKKLSITPTNSMDAGDGNGTTTPMEPSDTTTTATTTASATTTTTIVPLYRKARIDITWNKYHGQVHMFVESEHDPKGEAVDEPCLKVEEIASLTAQYQTYIPNDVLFLDNVGALHPPLVAYWVWEHTRHRHVVKMHLAQGSDIALHCILAIVTNMITVEKKSME